MVLGLKKFPEGRGVLAALLAAFLFFSCVEYDRDNPLDPGSPLHAGQAEPSSGSREPSSGSQEPIYCSSSVLVYALSSSSVEAGSSSEGAPSSSSAEADNPSSSSNAPLSSSIASSSSSLAPSSSSQEPSSSSSVPSSSSQEPSSSSQAPSSSSVVPSSSSTVSSSSSYGGLCAGFDPEAEVEHYGKMKKQFCDERDGKKYVYVVIGTQTWMAENLNYNAEGSKCYDNLESNCDKYGRLYNWATAMNNAPSSTAVPSGVRGVCPAGWHLPSDAEWTTLVDDVGGSSVAGTKLKSKSGWNSNGNGTDDYGFSALPGSCGCYFPDGGFFHVGDFGRWWSASEFGGNSSVANARDMGYDGGELAFWPNSLKSNLLSVRCVQD